MVSSRRKTTSTVSLIDDWYPIMHLGLEVSNMASTEQGKQRRPWKNNGSDLDITILTEKVEENLDLIRSKFSGSITLCEEEYYMVEMGVMY